MPPPRRRPATRRPRVAGRHHHAEAPAAEEDRGVGRLAVDPPAVDHPAVDRPTAEVADGRADLPQPRGRRGRPPSPRPQEAAARRESPEVEKDPARARGEGVAALVGLVAVLLIALVLTAWFRGEVTQLTESGAAANEALIDVGTTAQAAGQVRDALETVFSYDYTRLDENEQAAREVITGEFVPAFEDQFAEVREIATDQQAAVTATVPNIAVQSLQGDRAVLFAFLDQETSRRASSEPDDAAGRLIVTAEFVDGRWKIADVQPL